MQVDKQKVFTIGRKILGIIGLPLLGFLLYFFYTQFHIEIDCIFHKITGLYCPGCGITRMIMSLLELDFYQAFRYNSLGLILMPPLLIYIEYLMICWGYRKEDQLTTRLPNKILYTIIIIVLLYGILRNTDVFDFLAPTEIH